MQKASKFVNFTANLKIGSRIVLHKLAVILKSVTELLRLSHVVLDIALLLQNVEELRTSSHPFMFSDQLLNLVLYSSQQSKGVFG